MSALYRLEHTGIKVVTSLVDEFKQLQSAVGIMLSPENESDWHAKCRHLAIFIGQWSATKKDRYPQTWRSLLEVISHEMNLKELAQQIEDFMTGE